MQPEAPSPPMTAPTPTPMPPHRSYLKLAVVIVVAVVVVAALALVVYPMTLQPKVTLTDLNVYNYPCASGFFTGPTPPQYYVFNFTLYNTGDADGLTLVNFFIGTSNYQSASYFVPGHSNAAKSEFVTVNVCGTFAGDARIVSVTKA